MIDSYVLKFIESWAAKEGNVNTTESILEWIAARTRDIHVNIKRNKLSDSGFWFWDDKTGYITNKKKAFFSIRGIKSYDADKFISEQPILLQDEIGYLGIIVKEIDGVFNFLMQAKIEPGNINNIQISPTIQATRSNFLQLHEGSKPLYLDYFLNACNHEIIVDQIQSEQSSRFFKKRNRNIIIKVNEEIEVSPNHKWMTLGQLKLLMKHDNLINMDTRTVISCLPVCTDNITPATKANIDKVINDKPLFKSIFDAANNREIYRIYNGINNAKMFDNTRHEFCRLDELKSWQVSDYEIFCKEKSNFKVIFCDIEIEGREVSHWTQPLFMSTGEALFGLLQADIDGKTKFLIKLKPEIGCFDTLELGPTIQKEYAELTNSDNQTDDIEAFFMDSMRSKSGILCDVMLSEEGGRFYHEQNRNVIIKADYKDIPALPEGYYWLDYSSLNRMVQYNNVLNIQLRNLISLLEVN
ncbi:MAG: NDP-hexose 2,3-dehydratase family protein [Christensenellales bacterium]|jgi:oxidase EvaA